MDHFPHQNFHFCIHMYNKKHVMLPPQPPHPSQPQPQVINTLPQPPFQQTLNSIKARPNSNVQELPYNTVYIKDERGTPDRRGFPDRTVQPRPDSGHGAIFCLNRGSVRSGVKKTGRFGNGVVFSLCGYFFFGPGLNFDCSEMIYTIE